MKHIIDNSGFEFWYDKNDETHREGDGPAVTYSDGSEVWRKNRNLHRENGPAAININGTEDWWKNGKFINETYYN